MAPETWTVESFWLCECEACQFGDGEELEEVCCRQCGGEPIRLVTNRFLRNQ